tara:strand:- start:7693 stop:8496 length:804 start_codon:yes stop_codon:yes gene_type:complete
MFSNDSSSSWPKYIGAIFIFLYANTIFAGCPYFTRPEVESCDGVTRTNFYTEGSKVCFNDMVYECGPTSWTKIMPCEEYWNSNIKNAEDLEEPGKCEGKGRDNEFENLFDTASENINDDDMSLDLDPSETLISKQRELETKFKNNEEERRLRRLYEEELRENLRNSQENQSPSLLEQALGEVGREFTKQAIGLAIQEIIDSNTSSSSINASCQNASQEISYLQQKKRELQNARRGWGNAVKGSIVNDTINAERQIDNAINSIESQCY